jgi:hypothetical protein
MDENRRIPQRPRHTGRDVPHRRHVEDAFSLWLEQKLHELYDSVTREPLPPDLLQLIEGHRTERERHGVEREREG